MKIKEKHKLRKPSGPYLVGCKPFSYAYDPDEKDDKNRIIPGICFYPAKGTGEGNLKKYVSQTILQGTSGIETNSYINAPIGDGKHPLLLFSHGFSLFCEANTVQCEELASHGYIVISIGHQGGGSYELPNGEMMMLDMEKMMKDFQADAIGMGMFTKYSAWLAEDGKDASSQEHSDYYKKMIDNQPGFTAHSEIWIKDSLVALDIFLNEAEQESSALHNHVDRENIGAFGMSYGGSTALSLTHVSDLIKASANLDGFFYSTIWQKPIHKPIMLMQNDVGLFLTFPYLNAENDAYIATFKKSTHANFSDYNEIMAENYIAKGVIEGKEVEQAMLGEIDPNKMEDIMNALLLDFFNKYLKGKDSQIIDTDKVPDEVILLKK
ncbi:alpha/beta hydrolase family protein [Paenibacillus eucommiae]|uniref:Uncharacterized protein n=1 Tax=Paenibacillus eucommiae TaxID=1355755 RepID=A0ABS4IV91_9BACL|nr:hypothetical protein [Paenibacillus eucommiae]MBP1991505.1 hypothetical protein [Paenibacillus eucommiae]